MASNSHSAEEQLHEEAADPPPVAVSVGPSSGAVIVLDSDSEDALSVHERHHSRCPCCNAPVPAAAGDQAATKRQKRAACELCDGEGECEEVGTAGDAELNQCVICMEPWTDTGEHQISSLKCGHIFGKSCITTWLTNRVKCPTCNKKARKGDIRLHYGVPRLAALDTSEVDRLQRQLESAQEANAKLEKETSKLRCKLQQLQQEAALLRDRAVRSPLHAPPSPLVALRNPHSSGCGDQRTLGRPRVQVSHLPYICDLQDAKCFALDGMSSRVFIPTKFNNEVVLKKVSLLSPHTPRIIPLRLPLSTVIRDVHLDSSKRFLIMTAANKLMVLECHNETVVANYHLPAVARSCCWDAADKNMLYGGLNNGSVVLWDSRHGAQPMTTFPGLHSQPLHTLISTTNRNDFGGVSLLTGMAAGVWGWGVQPGHVTQGQGFMAWQNGQVMSASSPCTSLVCHPTSNAIITSHYHHNSDLQLPARHEVYQHNASGVEGGGWSMTRRLVGHRSCTVMCRGDAFAVQQGDTYFVSADEQDRRVSMWSVQSGHMVQRLDPHPSMVMQVTAVPRDDGVLIASLSSSQLQLHSCRITT